MSKPHAFVCVGAGLLQIPMIRAAQSEFGLRVIATDGNSQAPGLAMADLGLTIDTKDVEGHIQALAALREQYDIRGVATCGADVAVTVAACAEALRLPGIPVSAATMAQRKNLMRAILQKSGLDHHMPYWCTIDADKPDIQGQALRFWRHVKECTGHFGIVVKPVGQSASRGVTIVHGEGDLEPAIDEALSFSDGGNLLIEQRLNGREYSVEGIMDAHDQVIFFNIVERIFDYQHGIPMELGHINPATFSPVEYHAIQDLWRAASNALGVHWGPFKIDLLVQQGRPYILETAARLSGGWDCQATTPLSSGRLPVEALILLSCGEEVDPWYLAPRHPDGRVYAACVGLFPPPGRVTRIHPDLKRRHDRFIKECSGSRFPAIDLDREVQVRLSVQEGGVIERYKHCANRAGFLISLGPTREVAWKKASDMANAGAQMIQTEPVELE